MIRRSCRSAGLLVLCLLFSGPAWPSFAQDVPPPRIVPVRFGPIISPEIAPDGRVTFRLRAPDARDVYVAGDWMEGWGTRAPLVKGDSGLWAVTLGPLEPEYHGYWFYVDGVPVLDPSNPIIRRDGLRNASAFLIEGTPTELYAVQDVPHGVVSRVWYDSPTLGMKRQMYVYTPPGYEHNAEAYPVLYLLHGGGGDEDAWTTLGRAPQIIDNLIARGDVERMIVVMTNGNPSEAAAPGQAPAVSRQDISGISGMGSGRFELSLANDVIPYVDRTYRTLADKSHRAVAGLSMGGIQTMNLSFEHPDLFDYYGVMSIGLVERDSSGRQSSADLGQKFEALRSSGYALYWLACGEKDFLYEAANTLHAALNEHGIEHVYRRTQGGHTWREWRLYLSELAPLLFR